MDSESFWRHVKSIHSVHEGEEQEIENNGIRGFILDELYSKVVSLLAVRCSVGAGGV